MADKYFPERNADQMSRALNSTLKALEEATVRRGLHIEIAGIVVRDQCLKEIHEAEMFLVEDIAEGGPIIGLATYRSMHTTMLGINNALAMHDLPGLNAYEISRYLLDLIEDYCGNPKEEIINHYGEMLELMIKYPHELTLEGAFKDGLETVKANYN